MPPPPETSTIQLVLFDVGGVLVELSGIAVILEWLGPSMTEEELWLRWLRSESVRQFETGRMSAGDFAVGVTHEFGLAIGPERFLESFMDWPLGLFPETVELLARIPGRYRRALLSNSNALHWPRIMNEMGLGPLFEHRFVSHLTGKIKPDADAFEEVVETLDCRPENVLFLDDNRLNTDAAADLGMHAVRVRGPHEAERALIDFGIIPNEAPR